MILMFYFWKKIKQSRKIGKTKNKENNHTSMSGPREREGPNKTKIKRKGKTFKEDQRNSIDVNDSVTV
jgi:hypothetical protein